jgi:Transposase IS66 family
LSAFAGEDVRVYLIARLRGYEQACEILVEGFSGVLERDGWAPYRHFTAARHRTCHAHLLRRTGELIASSIAVQTRVPHAARRIFKAALALREQRDAIDVVEFGPRVRNLGERADTRCLRFAPGTSPTCACSGIFHTSASVHILDRARCAGTN